VLILPAETPDARLTRRLEDGNLDRLAVNSTFTALWLRCRNREQRAIADRFDEAIP
jgi:hypothetical protein